MIVIDTTPTDRLNVSRLEVMFQCGQMFGLNFKLLGYAKYKNADGEEVITNEPIIVDSLSITGADWDGWLDVDDRQYVADIALAKLGLTGTLQAEPAEEPAAAESSEE
jgi:hypothetical protein